MGDEAPKAVPSYAKAGGPPEDWWRIQVLHDGKRVFNVVEVNVDEGWVVMEVFDCQGNFILEYDNIKTVRVRGNYELRWSDSNEQI